MKLICPECRRENEVERIYCHDCGARLDRSALAKTKPKGEDPKETQRRLRSMLDARGAKLRHQLKQGGKFILGAIVLACLVQMFRAPDLPKKSDGLSELPTQINLDLEEASMAAPGRPPLRYTEEQVNAYLSYRLKSKRKALSGYLQFEGIWGGIEEGFARVTVERSLLGVSIFTSAIFSPRSEAGALTARILGGKIGRLPIHPALMKYGGFLFSDVGSALERERKAIAKLGAVELHPQTLIINPKPGAPPAVPQPTPPPPAPEPAPQP